MLTSGILFAAVCLLLSGLPLFAAIILMASGAAVTVIFSVLKKPKFERLIIVGFFVFAASLSFLLKYQTVISPSEALFGNVRFVGTVTDGPEANAYGYRYTVNVKSVNGKDLNTSAYVYSVDGLGVEIGDKISSVGEVNPIENSLFYNAKRQNYAKGISISFETDNCSVLGEDPLQKFFGKLKGRITEGISSSFTGEEGGLLCGIIVNNKSSVPDEVKEKLTAAGYSHLINVSGLHMSIVTGFIYLLLNFFFKTNRRLSALITLLGILFYIFLTGFSVSAVRAGIMLIIMNIGTIINKENDSLNSLGLAVTLILMFNPYAVFDPSLALSALSTFGIIYSTDRILELRTNEKIGDRTEKVLTFLAPSFSAVVFSAPASMLFFEEINVISAVANLFISFLITPLVYSGMAFSLFYVLELPVFAKLVGIVTGVCLKAVLFMADLFSGVSLSVKTVSVGAKIGVLSAVVLVFVLMRKRTRRNKILSGVLAGMTALSFITGLIEERERKRDAIYMLSEGDSCSLVCITDEEAHCFGAANKSSGYNISSFLRSQGISEIGLLHIQENNRFSLSAAKQISGNNDIKTLTASNEDVKAMLQKSAGLEAKLYSEVAVDGLVFLDGKPRVYFDGFYADVNEESDGFIVKITVDNGEEFAIYRSGIENKGEINYNRDSGKIYIGNGIYRLVEKNGKIKVTGVKAHVGDNG